MQQSTRRISYSLTGLNPYPWIRWWYSLAAPAAPANAENLPLSDREFLRKGKLTSLALLVETIFLSITMSTSIDGPTPIGQNHAPAILVILMLATFTFIATLLNRAGKLLPAGVLVVISLEVVELVGSLFIRPDGMAIAEVGLIFFLLHPLIISTLLLPAWGILVVAGINVVLTALIVFAPFFTRTPELVAFLGRGGNLLMFAGPSVTQILCAFICFVVITSLQESLKRADNAEEVTKLHEMVTKQTSQELQTKRQLEGEVREVIAGMTRFANGDNQARIILDPGGSLWSVASSINNMIGRFVRLREQEQPMQQSFVALKAYIAATQLAKARGVPITLPRTGTEVDILIRDLLTHAQGIQPIPYYPPTQMSENNYTQ